jgi:hypothetical protein
MGNAGNDGMDIPYQFGGALQEQEQGGQGNGQLEGPQGRSPGRNGALPVCHGIQCQASRRKSAACRRREKQSGGEDVDKRFGSDAELGIQDIHIDMSAPAQDVPARQNHIHAESQLGQFLPHTVGALKT